MDTIARLNASLAGRYIVERDLGAGGMATVYLARDLKHDRAVAIKVLHPDLARSLTSERFLREIAITARLNHPHILALLDSGQAGDGDLLYYVMPVATGESLRDRIAKGGAMPVAEALRVAMDATEALVHAHAQGVVHRDIKPENVLLSGHHAIVVDFGIAKAVGHARDTTTLTSEGTSLGTPAYMAPEQAAGDGVVDHRADIYAVGALLFEMLAGAPAFAGTWRQVMMDKLAKEAPSLASRCPAASPGLVRLVARCLARDPADRPATAEALLGELHVLAAPERAPGPARPRAPFLVGGFALAAAAILAVLFVRDRRARWVHETALPTIQRLVEADELDSAFALAAVAAERAPGDSAVDAAWARLALTQTFLSEPAGAEVKRAAVSDTTRWIRVGTTPTHPVRIPRNAWFYRYTRPGYRQVTVMGARLGGSYVPIPSPILLRRVSDPDSDMVLLRGSRLRGTLYGLVATDTFDLADFLMDKLEVTNRQYKAFVDAGGYTNRTWWDSTIVRGGNPVPWAEAVALFTDKTGRPGPSSWEGGAPPNGTEDLPVGGVSWYEARAYARFAGKALPTVVEWNAAAMPEAARWVVPQGRYESEGPVRGGAARGVSPRGVYDMAGNVREWTVNAREPGSRYILGGGWTDPPYLFSEIYTQPELDRSPINGIRLVRRVGNGKDLARASAPIPGLSRDFNAARPVDDATYRGFLSLYDYDRTPLNPKVTSRDTTAPDWAREDIEFDLPGSAGRMWAVLFLPRRVRAPYQTVVLWPASDAFILHDRRNLSMTFVDYIVRSGRAVLYPIYEHTYGRGSSMAGDILAATIEHRDQMLRWAKEMRRSIDYVATRPDIDTTRLAFVGTSWGGRIGGLVLAVEPRFRAAVLNVAGLSADPTRPEEDPVNFLPRIRIPVLMLSGRYDSVFPYEVSQKPFLRLLGSPPADKKQILFDGGHFLPRAMMVAECLKWLDHYLGPVTRQ
ncbi:MAG TPA: protein kinase [Gemmatimonadaceae bacterium]|nr:protein kinase [Gemmatimonadaceae bacterium]